MVLSAKIPGFAFVGSCCNNYIEAQKREKKDTQIN